MTTKIHHNTAKKAKAAGITLVVEGQDIVAMIGDRRLASHMSGSVALDQAIAKLNGSTAPVVAKAKPRKLPIEDDDEQDDDEQDDEDQDEDQDNSIVKQKYKTRYKPFRMTCGDDLAQAISAHVKEMDDEAGAPRIDPVKLKRFAQANGVWDPKYVNLNVGMRRMNCANRLRAKVRKGHVVVWG
jgi:hypothetical protein